MNGRFPSDNTVRFVPQDPNTLAWQDTGYLLGLLVPYIPIFVGGYYVWLYFSKFGMHDLFPLLIAAGACIISFVLITVFITFRMMYFFIYAGIATKYAFSFGNDLIWSCFFAAATACFAVYLIWTDYNHFTSKEQTYEEYEDEEAQES